uniref:Alpha/beta hydrolase fold-3 domain-containing protein n=1 Tax=Branchiostoma floridae TaxID=7739 RepID=C3YGD9_BRAFL|eukprot:XP_002604649.1 hypothetical protein BRAFLDRAFT_92883 [Branchiostoma floridae]
MILADVSYSMAAARVLSLFSILIPIYMSSAVLSASLANLTSSDNSSSNQPYDTQLISPDAWSSRRNRAAVTNREIVLGRRNRRAADYCPVIVEKEFYVTQLLHLRCLCQPINIRHRLLSWTVVPRDGQGEKPVLFDEEDRLELGTEFDMTIRHAQVTDSGIYYCRDTSRERLLVSYDLTVKPAKSGVRLSLVALSENPLPNRTAAEMTMFSLWSPWGQCNRCGGSGERARIGICHVESENFPEHLGTRKVFACDSENLPSFAREVFGEEIRRPGHTIPFYEIRRPDERRVEFCTEPCPIGICHVESENFPEHLGTRKVFACDSENLPSFAREVFGEEIRRPGHTIPSYEIRRPDERRVEFCTEPCPIEHSEDYNVDSSRIGVLGDSSGGNLAAAVALKLNRPEKKNLPPLRFQSLLYPALQALDFRTDSYKRGNSVDILTIDMMAFYWCLYLTGSYVRHPDFFSNNHIPPELRKRLYTVGSVRSKDNNSVMNLPDDMKDIVNPYFAPLVADDADLRGLPPAYILTCGFDVLRDDGIMYAKRLQTVDVPVVHDHLESAFHGIAVMGFKPFSYSLGRESLKKLADILRENL